jgi:hypothetical protein
LHPLAIKARGCSAPKEQGGRENEIDRKQRERRREKNNNETVRRSREEKEEE